MRAVVISDEHEQQDTITLPEGDILIHCGDETYEGKWSAFTKFVDWMANTSFKTKLFVAGNHSFNFQNSDRQHSINYLKDKGITYLENSGIVVDNISFFGVPYVPNLPRWALPEYDGCYDNIPDDTQVLISHSPIYGVLDNNSRHFGSTKLKNVIEYRLSNLTHFFCGHIHESYGQTTIKNSNDKEVVYVNASICNRYYEPLNKPTIIDI